ncbi:MAG: DEAD/DEAH box helicase [Desulfobacterales bacterium]|nr:DEAD/DEAH box helicase [Desulfobacterales bacterium]
MEHICRKLKSVPLPAFFERENGMSFSALGLKENLVKAVEDLGFKTPTPIQVKAIPTLLTGERDFVGLAQTGTGKTGAFGLPMIQLIDPALCRPQGIVICPTRELCMQITNDFEKFAAHVKGISIVAVYGGADISTQIRKLRNGAQIIVATPGRLLDLINRKAVNLSGISYTVLDEADEMLNMGFQEDINSILDQVPARRKVWLFSATMPNGVAAIAKNYLTNPVEVTVGAKNQTPANIVHTYYMTHEKQRYEALKRIIDFTPDMFALIFCRTRKETQTVAESLMQDGYLTESLHGDLSQTQRDYVMRKFRAGNIRILVATDVAARGLDVEDISHVIHYNLPDEAEAYTHRSGRTARAGKSGASIVLINTREMRRIRELQSRGNIRFECGKIPDGRAICEKQLIGLVKKIVDTDVNRNEIADYLPAVYDALGSIDKEELIQRFISAEFNRLLEYYRHAGDINAKTAAPSVSRPARPTRPTNRKERLNGKQTQRFFINIGQLDKINEGAIVRLICDKSGIRSSMIGAIDLNREFSFFEVEKSAAEKIHACFNDARLDGRPVKVRKVEEDARAGSRSGYTRKAEKSTRPGSRPGYVRKAEEDARAGSKTGYFGKTDKKKVHRKGNLNAAKR